MCNVCERSLGLHTTYPSFDKNYTTDENKTLVMYINSSLHSRHLPDCTNYCMFEPTIMCSNN